MAPCVDGACACRLPSEPTTHTPLMSQPAQLQQVIEGFVAEWSISWLHMHLNQVDWVQVGARTPARSAALASPPSSLGFSFFCFTSFLLWSSGSYVIAVKSLLQCDSLPRLEGYWSIIPSFSFLQIGKLRSGGSGVPSFPSWPRGH